MEKTIWVCSSCGSRDVEVKQWVTVNGEKVCWDLGVENDETWCPHCEDHLGITDIADYKTTES